MGSKSRKQKYSKKPGFKQVEKLLGIRSDSQYTSLFKLDSRIRAVYVAGSRDDVHFEVIRNSTIPTAFSNSDSEIGGIPIKYVDIPDEVKPLVLTLSTEDLRTEIRPLVNGLQIQNYDDDMRKGSVHIGTLGCFVKLSDGRVGLLSN